MYIYIVYNKEMNPLYAGKTKNIKARLECHRSLKKYPAENSHYWYDDVFYIRFKRFEARVAKELEKKYIRIFRPAFNKQYNPNNKRAFYGESANNQNYWRGFNLKNYKNLLTKKMRLKNDKTKSDKTKRG